jgi:RAQPRD family integrative conjugative element protein
MMSVGTPAISIADTVTERAELVRLIHELEGLDARIERAEAAASSTQRVHFQYSWLRSDLARVKAGIREYLDSVPVTPRDVPPLAGDYIR